MILTAERSELLSNFLIQDKERAYGLLEQEAEVAVAKINSYGYDFSVEEVQEFGKQMLQSMNQSGELSEESLESVSGGLVVTAGVLAAGVALFGAGLSASVAIGIAVANKKGW